MGTIRLQQLTGNVTEAFLVPFGVQIASMLVISSFLVVLFSQRFRIVRAAQVLTSRFLRKPEEKNIS